MTTESEIAGLLDGLTLIASHAAAAILAVPQLDLNQRHKPDSSPVTAADDASETVILAGLAAIILMILSRWLIRMMHGVR